MTINLYGKEINLSEDQTEELLKIALEHRKKRYRCSQVCGTWNREDRDCEIYGSQHPSPSTCIYHLINELKTKEE